MSYIIYTSNGISEYEKLNSSITDKFSDLKLNNMYKEHRKFIKSGKFKKLKDLNKIKNFSKNFHLIVQQKDKRYRVEFKKCEKFDEKIKMFNKNMKMLKHIIKFFKKQEDVKFNLAYHYCSIGYHYESLFNIKCNDAGENKVDLIYYKNTIRFYKKAIKTGDLYALSNIISFCSRVLTDELKYFKNPLKIFLKIKKYFNKQKTLLKSALRFLERNRCEGTTSLDFNTPEDLNDNLRLHVLLINAYLIRYAVCNLSNDPDEKQYIGDALEILKSNCDRNKMPLTTKYLDKVQLVFSEKTDNDPYKYNLPFYKTLFEYLGHSFSLNDFKTYKEFLINKIKYNKRTDDDILLAIKDLLSSN